MPLALSCSKKAETGPVTTFISPSLTANDQKAGEQSKNIYATKTLDETPDKTINEPINQNGPKGEGDAAENRTDVTNYSSVEPEDIEKLKKVFASLSDKCKNAIKNGDPEEFLKDLKAVLADDKDDLLLLCDKTHYLPEGYAPKDLVLLQKTPEYNVIKPNIYLRAPCIPSLTQMGADAAKQGITLLVSSTYRSYDRQVEVYNRLVALDGQEQADRESARPGTSQHQTGSVIDFGNIDSSFEETAPGKWLLKNAWKYGWSLSFPDGYEDVTGYRYECWHYRYIGKKACEFQRLWFSDVQQFMLEFIDEWRKLS